MGNTVSGVIGGASGGITLISFTNARAGGRSPIAGITTALVSLLALVFLPLSEIPLAALAGILVVTGWRVIEWRYLRNLLQVPRGYAAVMLITLAVAVLIDFTTAILVGLVVAALVDASRSERGELERLVSVPLLDSQIWRDESADFSARTGLVVLPERVSVASARELVRIVGGDIQASEAVILDFGRTTFIDDTAATLIGQVVAGRRVVITGMSVEVAKMMDGFASIRSSWTATDVEQAKELIRVALATEMEQK